MFKFENKKLTKSFEFNIIKLNKNKKNSLKKIKKIWNTNKNNLIKMKNKKILDKIYFNNKKTYINNSPKNKNVIIKKLFNFNQFKLLKKFFKKTVNINIKTVLHDFEDTNKPNIRIFGNMKYTNNKIYLFGGMNNIALNDFWKFDVKLNKWKKLKNIFSFTGIYKNICTIYNKKLYIIGGIIQKYNFLENFNKNIYTYNFINKKVESKNINFNLKNFSFCRNNNWVYITGGFYENYNKYLFILNLDNFNLKKCLINLKIMFHSMNFIDNNSKLYNYYLIFGGINSNGELLNSLYMLKLKNDKYFLEILKTEGQLPEKRYKHSSHYLITKKIFIVLGGTNIQDNWNFNDIYYLNLKNKNWNKVIISNFFNINSFCHCDNNIDSIFIFGGLKNNIFFENKLIELKIINLN